MPRISELTDGGGASLGDQAAVVRSAASRRARVNFVRVANIAAMTALTGMSDNDTVEVLGYTSEDDGGGGTFYWDASSTTTADSGTIFAADAGGTGRWLRLFSGSLNARWFGATGDGSTDDTSALQAWLDAFTTFNRRARLYLPAGTYLTTGLALTLGASASQSLFIHGDARRASVLRKTGSTTAAVLTLTGGADPTAASLDIQHIEFDGATVADVDGLVLQAVAVFRVEQCHAERCRRGLVLSSSLIGEIAHTRLSSNQVGLYARETGFANTNAVTVRECKIQSNTGWGIDWGDGSLLRVRDCDIELNGAVSDGGTGGLIIRDTVDNEFGYALITIDGTWFESNRGRSVDVENTANLYLSVRDVQVINPGSGWALRVQGADRVEIDNSFFPSGELDVTAFRLTCRNVLATDLLGTRTQFSETFQNCTFVNQNVTDTGFGSDVQIGNGKALRIQKRNGTRAYDVQVNAGDNWLEFTQAAGTEGYRFDRTLHLEGHAWDGALLRLGSYRLWVDASGDLRINSGAPTSDTDGTVVGTQT